MERGRQVADRWPESGREGGEMKKVFYGYVENDKHFFHNALYDIVDIDGTPRTKENCDKPQKYRVTVTVEKVDVIKTYGKKYCSINCSYLTWTYPNGKDDPERSAHQRWFCSLNRKKELGRCGGGSLRSTECKQYRKKIKLEEICYG